MVKIATDIYSFSELRTNGFTYVDKTAALWLMASGEVGKQFFIARPRRFGKSLAVSTLKALFEGRRELFRGLAIESKWDWSQKWPVLHLDMGSLQARSVSEFEALLSSHLRQRAAGFGIKGLQGVTPGDIFTNHIDTLARMFPYGRIDMTAETPSDYNIIEFKLHSPTEAMEQIRGKEHAGRYALSPKHLSIIAISFSSEKRVIVEELMEEP